MYAFFFCWKGRPEMKMERKEEQVLEDGVEGVSRYLDGSL
jgi:hypothetical protein